MPRSKDYRRALDAQITEATLAAERCEAEARAHRNTAEVLRAAKAAAEKAAPRTAKQRTVKVPRMAVSDTRATAGDGLTISTPSP